MPYTEKRGDGPYPWRVRWLLPQRGPKGQKLYDSASGFADEDAAMNHGLDMEADIRRGRWQDPKLAETKIDDWWGRVFPTIRRAPNTLLAYERAYRNHIQPRFGHLAIGEPRRIDIEAWRIGLEDSGLSDSAITIIFAVLGHVFTSAADNDMIKRSPIPPPERGSKVHRRSPQTREERPGVAIPLETLGSILDRLPTFDVQLLAVMKAMTGMRFSEVAAVNRITLRLFATQPGRLYGFHYLHPRWGAVHEDEHALRYFGPPKSGPGRVFDLPPFLISLLFEYLAALPQEQPLLFPNLVGDPWHANYWRSGFWRPACDGAPAYVTPAGHAHEAVPPIWPGLVPHDLKHTAKAIMADGGVHPTMIDYVMGHAQPGAPGVYAHPTTKMRIHRLAVLEETWRQLEWDGWHPITAPKTRKRRKDSTASPILLPDGLAIPQDVVSLMVNDMVSRGGELALSASHA